MQILPSPLKLQEVSVLQSGLRASGVEGVIDLAHDLNIPGVLDPSSKSEEELSCAHTPFFLTIPTHPDPPH